MLILQLFRYCIFKSFILLVVFKASCEVKEIKLLLEPISSSYLAHKEVIGFPYSDASGPFPIRNYKFPCYNFETGNTKYDFCPFKNITQTVTSLNFNIYNSNQRLLGVWGYWNVEEDRFASAIYDRGELCQANKNRSVLVKFECGRQFTVVNVSEPSLCEYLVIFQLPIVCNKDAMVVYNSLDDSLRYRLDQLNRLFDAGLITDKGIQVGKSDVYNDAGFKSLRNYTSLVKDLYRNEIIKNLMAALNKKT